MGKPSRTQFQLSSENLKFFTASDNRDSTCLKHICHHPFNTLLGTCPVWKLYSDTHSYDKQPTQLDELFEK